MLNKTKGKDILRPLFLSLVLACAALVPGSLLATDTALAAEGDWANAEAQLAHVTDAADILTDDEEGALETQAQLIEDQYGFGAYIVTVDDYTDFTGSSVFDAATTIYREYSLGAGEGKDGLLLLLSMNDRDYSLITYGDEGNYAFNDEGRELMTDFFLDDFANDEWSAGFEDYLTWTAAYLDAAATGEPYSDGNIPMSRSDAALTLALYIAAIILIPLIVMFIAVRGRDAKMKTVAAATEASHYVSSSLNLTRSNDTFTHVTETAVLIPKNNDRPSTSRSGGFSGTSGKF